MSSVYVLEPPTKGKVVLNTTMGPLDIELWPKEAPKAVRNFVQLCLDGYYDDTIFHRVIKSFLVQGGDPTGTGTGGESIYGVPFSDEFHSRLRFNHRGLVACANAGTPHSNGSQFFITLDRCDWIDRKNTIFGKVTGDSIFNVLTLGDVETDKDDRPLYPPPKILSAEILWNPFDDVVPRKVADRPHPPSKADTGEQQKKIAVKKLNVLSFGEEVEEEEKYAAAVEVKIKSIHDVLDDPRFLKEGAQKEPLTSEQVEKNKDTVLSVREALSTKKDDFRAREIDDHSDDDGGGGGSGGSGDDDDEANFDARMRSQILRKRREMGDSNVREKLAADKSHHKDHNKSNHKDHDKFNRKDREVSAPRSRTDDFESQISKAEKLSLKKKGIGSEARAERLAKADADLQLLGQAEQERQMHKQKKRRLHGREEDTMAKLQKFKASLVNQITASSSDSTAEDYLGWQANRLKFIPDSSEKNNMTRKDDPNDYVVHDPLLEKGKEKFNKMQAKFKRSEREWAGKSLT